MLTLAGDLLRVILILLAGALVFLCTYRYRRAHHPALRRRLLGLGLLAAGVTAGTAQRLFQQDDPTWSLPLTVLGFAVCVWGLSDAHPADGE